MCFWFSTIAVADEVEMKAGEVFQGRIKGFDGKVLVFELALSSGTATLRFEVGLIKSLKFVQTPEETRLLGSADAKDLGALHRLWAVRKDYIAIPGSDAGQFGRALARVLLAENKPENAATVLKLLDILVQRDWDKSRASEITGYRMQAQLQLGNTQDAMREAEKLADAVQGGGAEIVQAKYFAAQGAAAKLKVLEAEFPRWFEIKDKIKERDTLYNAALDDFLFPVVFQADDAKACARGLMAAAELYAANRDNPEAILRLKEIVEHFPDPEYASRARGLMTKLQSAAVADSQTQ
jgi:hypothetical protein